MADFNIQMDLFYCKNIGVNQIGNGGGIVNGSSAQTLALIIARTVKGKHIHKQLGTGGFNLLHVVDNILGAHNLVSYI